MKLLRLANVFDLSTGTVWDGVTIELPDGEELPSTVAEVHALIDRIAVGCESVIEKHNPKSKDFVVGDRNVAVEKAVKKVRALMASKTSAARGVVGRCRMVDCVESK